MFDILTKLKSISGDNNKYIVKMIAWDILKAIFNGISLMAIGYTILCIVSYDSIFVNTDSQFSHILIVGTIMCISVIGKIIAGYYATKNKNSAAYNITYQSRLEIADKLKELNMGYFNSTNLGTIAGSLTTVLNDLEGTGFYIIEHIIAGAFQTVIMTLGILFFDIPTGIITICGLAVSLFISSISQKSADNLTERLSDAKLDMDSAVLEYMNGISVVKSFGRNERVSKRLRESIHGIRERNYSIERHLAPVQSFYIISLKVFSVAIIAMTLYRYVVGGISLTYAVMLIILSFSAFRSIEVTGQMQNVRGIAAKAIDIIEDMRSYSPMPQGYVQKVSNGDIQIQHMNFGYNEKSLVLHDINIEIQSKSTVALAGPSGSGKTTLCHLIARFWDVNEGSIFISGRDVHEYNYDRLLSSISIIFQDVYLFEDTIRNNICFGKPDATMEEVIEAARKAGCHNFISALEDGYDTVLIEGGRNLSGGERQRISIARALIKDAPIVIIDEATSSVDPENEELILSAIKELSKDKTVIMIAHRLNTIRHVDNIFVLAEGQVVQSGNHNLLMKEEGIYKEFVDIRSKAESWRITLS